MPARGDAGDGGLGLNAAADELIAAMEGLSTDGAMARLRRRLARAVSNTRTAVSLSKPMTEEGEQLERLWRALDALAAAVEHRRNQEN